MINARYMYLRPGNLYKEFIVEENRQTISENGQVVNDYVGDGTKVLKGCLAEADPEVKEKWSQLGHQVSHTIAQSGLTAAKPGDRLVLGNRKFIVEGIDNAGDLGIAVMYFAREMV